MSTGETIYNLACEIERLQKEVAHWKANHEDMRRRNAFLQQRPDLDVTRIQIYEDMKRENEKLGNQVARLQSSTGACALIRLEQKVEELQEENARLRAFADLVKECSSEWVDEWRNL